MAKHHKNQEVTDQVEQPVEEAVEVEQPVEEAVEVEQPKEKTGDKSEATTSVDKSEKKERAPRTPKNVKYRILEGVDATKFIGQRGHVIKALQKLAGDDAEAYFTAEEIAAATEGLVSRTPVLDSVTYHLKGMAKDGQVVTLTPPAEEKKEEAAA